MGIEDFIQLMKSKQGGQSLREFATSIGVSAAYLSDIYLRNRNPGTKVATALGYRVDKKKTVITTFIRKRG